jgi:uncharacterized protein (TIGR03435 family)
VRPEFEAATLKPDDVPGGLTISPIFPQRSGDRFTWDNAPLSMMMAYAYSIPITRIEGFKTDGFYSVAAKIDPTATDEQARLMLQALLVEKLKIAAHRETREMQGYALVIAKNGTKLKAADPAADLPPMPEFLKGEPATSIPGKIVTLSVGRSARGVAGRGVSMPQLADELSKILRTPVADHTGLTGKYYFDFEFQPDSNPNTQSPGDMNDDLPSAPSIFSALPDKLGLKLEKAKVAAEYLVVEHAEKPAAE